MDANVQRELEALRKRVDWLERQTREFQSIFQSLAVDIGVLRGTRAMIGEHLGTSLHAMRDLFSKRPLGVKMLSVLDGSDDPADLPPDLAQQFAVFRGVWRSMQAMASAERKLAKDPKQAAKDEAKKLWLERRAGKHPDLRWNWQFAAECVRRWPVLTSPDTIKGWCTKWEKEARPENKRAS